MEGLSYQPFGRDTWRDPFPLYARLREEDPVHRSPHGFWVLSRFDDVFAAARDTDTYSSAQGLTFVNEKESLSLPPTLVMMDPPDHSKYRRLVSRGFTPRRVAEIEPAVRAFVSARVDRLIDQGGGDLVGDLARPLPCFVVAHYLGVPEEDRSRFEEWTHSIVQHGSSGDPYGAEGALVELYSYFAELIEYRRAHPGEDMISDLVRAEWNGAPLRLEEIVGYAFVMIAGGNDTTTGLIAGAAELLTEDPDQRRLLEKDLTLLPGAVEEFLRLTSPVQGLARVTKREVGLQDKTLAAGDRVLLCYAAANRDWREFGEDAERLDVTRPIGRFLTFSSGPHFCLGAAAARLQARVAFEELLRRCPDFVVEPTKGEFADGPFVRRYAALPVTLRS